MSMPTTITAAEWRDSQAHELAYWRNQYIQGNPEQEARWNWYALYVFAGWWDRARWRGMRIMDYGSGPAGVLHRITAARKVAVDSLMPQFEAIGYQVRANDVDARTEIPDERFNLIFCLNMLDHVADPGREIQRLSDHLRPSGELALCVDLRPESKRDACHKLVLTDDMVRGWVDRAGLIGPRRLVAHQAGNPTVQWVAVLTKKEDA